MHFETSRMGFEFATKKNFWFVPFQIIDGTYKVQHESGATIHVSHQELAASKFQVVASFSFVEPIFLQDIVIRAVIRVAGQSRAEIAGQKIDHASSNRYFQYPAQSAWLFGQIQTAELNASSSDLSGWRQELYVRDEAPETWIVHLRIMPIDGNYWIRWQTRYGTLFSLHAQPSNFVVPLLFKRLLLRAERTGRRPNIQSQRLGYFPANESVQLTFSGLISPEKALRP